MKLISELLKEAEEENRRNSGFLTECRNQKLREQWVLGKFAMKYNKNKKAQDKIIFAEPSETPDFKIFDCKKNWMFNVEITEALDKNTKRSSEYKTQTEEIIFIDRVNYLPVIKMLILKKCSKDYPNNTILIIYFDMFSSIYDKFKSENFSSLLLQEKCSLSQIWLLDSDGNNILQIS